MIQAEPAYDVKLKAAQDELAKERAQCQALQAQFAAEKQQHQVTKEWYTKTFTGLSTCLTTLERTDYCRNCGNEFLGWIETSGPNENPSYLLRCKDCRCRHWS